MSTVKLIYNGFIWRTGLRYKEENQICNWLKFDFRTGKIVANGIGTPVLGNFVEEYDLKGRWVFPGFHDAHSHVEWQGRYSRKDMNFSDCKTVTAFQEKLHKLVVNMEKKHTDDEGAKYIIGFGWSQENMDSQITSEVLDVVSKNIPVLIYRWDAHMAVANSKALQLADIDSTTQSPQGGEIGHYPPCHSLAGEPNGLLYEAGVNIVTDNILISSQQRKQNILHGLDVCLQNGITSIHCCDENCWREYVDLANDGLLTIPCFSATWITDYDCKEPNHPSNVGERHGDMLVSTAIKIFVDGALGSKTAALSVPYRDDDKNKPPNYGILIQDQDELNKKVKFVNDRGFQLEIHTIGDKAVDFALNALEVNKVPPEKRPILVHCQILRPDLLERMKKAGVVASLQPQFTFTDSTWVFKFLPDELCGLIYPYKTLYESGVHCAGGTDMPCNLPTPLMAVYDSIFQSDTVRNPKNPPLLPNECLNFTQAMDLLTIDAAYLDNTESVIGKLEPGYLANFIILNSPRDEKGSVIDISSNPGLLLNTTVAETWVKGNQKFVANQLNVD